MQCPICEKDMELDNVLVSKTTSPEEDDQYRDMWCCDPCEYYQEVQDNDNDL